MRTKAKCGVKFHLALGFLVAKFKKLCYYLIQLV